MRFQFFFRIFVLLFCYLAFNNLHAEDPFVLQHKLSKLKPVDRLDRLEKMLNPPQNISLQMVDQWQREKQFQKCLQDEGEYKIIETAVIEKLEKALKQKKLKAINEFSTQPFKLLNKRAFKLVNNFDGITLSKAEGIGSITSGWKNSFLGDYSKIVDLKLDGVFYEIDHKSRNKKNLDYSSVNVRVHYDVRGLDQRNRRINDRGELDLAIAKRSGRWVIVGNEFLNASRVTLKRKPAFAERTKEVSLGNVEINERSEAIRRGGYALAVDDINGDGYPDIYSGSAKQSQIFWGQKNGQWKAGKNALTELKAVKSSIFADFDNDGDKDAIMTLFEYDKDDSDIAYFKNEKGVFKRLKGFVKGKLKYNLPMPAAVADFNKDGYLDAYIGFPGKQDFTIIDQRKSQGTYPQGLFSNLGKAQSNKVFVDVTKTVWRDSDLSQYVSLYPHSSLATDYDFDGDVDLLVVDDRSNLSPIYDNQDGNGFKLVNDQLGVDNKAYGMSVAVGDLNNDGNNEIAMTNVNFHARQRFHSSCNQNWYFDFPDDPGLRLFSSTRSAKTKRRSMMEITNYSGVMDIGEGGAGIEFVDYNNDGLLDIYVANGLWSGESEAKTHDLSSLFTRAVADKKTFNDVLTPNRNYRKKDFSFISVLRDESISPTKSMAGFQRNRLFLNLGNLEFLEVGFLEGVDSRFDGYIISKADVDKDGKMDLLLRNGDPGTLKYSFPTIQFFKNTYPKRNSLIFTLEGTESNRDAIGTSIEVTTTNNKKMIRSLVANNGPAQSEKILHFGLGHRSKVKSVVVRWPSGKTEKYGEMKKGRYHLKEGSGPKIALSQ